MTKLEDIAKAIADELLAGAFRYEKRGKWPFYRYAGVLDEDRLARAVLSELREVTPGMLVAILPTTDHEPSEDDKRIAAQACFLLGVGKGHWTDSVKQGALFVEDWRKGINAILAEHDARNTDKG